MGLDAFSHLEVIFVFDRDAEDQPIGWMRHPRGDSRWPIVGTFAQRAGAGRIASAQRSSA
jgi:tRNA (Thr-GGU) A37 N-methylase